MAKYKIAWLPGDGVGNEVLEAAKIVLEKMNFDAEYIHGDIGWEFWCKEGDPLPERTVELLKNVDAAMFGAITSKPIWTSNEELAPELQGKGLVYRSPIVRMRQQFNLYSCLRPTKAYPGNPLNYKDDIDIVVFRENTEDLYAGVEFTPVPDEVAETLKKNSPSFKKFENLKGDEYAISCKINTKQGSENIIRAAFEYCKEHGRKKLTVVHKSNVVRATDGLFFQTAREMAKDYPMVELDEGNIDAMTMWILKNPERFEVLVAPNLYGDIVSDLCAQLVGGLGFACSGNIGDKLAVFEPTHGSAPKYYGQYKVNPLATFLSAKMMLDWLGEAEDAARLDKAITEVISEGKVRTYDMGGSHSTLEMAQAVADKL
jgi:3-isopropylmalate dehydrogenase